MTMQIRKAERRKAKLRLGISAPTGAGKTYSSLLIAAGIGPKVGLIDTENGSGDLYANDKLVRAALPNGYDIINISAPYDPQKYIDAMQAFEDAKYDVIILDSLSHAWAGAGGLLDKQGKEADKTGNSYTAWRKVTPQHNALVDKLIQSPSHIIACIRAKTEYVQEKNEQGKTVVRKVGMAPIFRDGFEYDMTVFGEMDQQHNFQASKDRTGLFGDQFFVPSKKTGEMLLGWLNSGVEVVPEPKPSPSAQLQDSIPEFAAPTLEQRAKEMGRAIDQAASEEHLNSEVLAYVKTMDDMAREQPAWHGRMLEKINRRRDDILAAKTTKPKRTKREPDVADSSGMDDGLPESMQTSQYAIKPQDKSQSEMVTEALTNTEVNKMFDEEKAKNINALKNQTRGAV